MNWSDRREQWEISEAEVFEAVWRCYHDDETDAWGGGVPTDRIAGELGASQPAVRSHLRELVDKGFINRVQGVNPETRYPRDSYIPAPVD